MRMKLLIAAMTSLAAMLFVAVPMTAPMIASAAVSGGSGLWSSSFMATPPDCGEYGRDGNGFCYIDDGGSVELGVKFTTSTPLLITGVRVYRVDTGTVTGSLWQTDGTLLAKGTFGAQASHGWQDLMFDSPVSIMPGQTYIASYFAPNADYAFQWDYFINAPLTVGPITALQSVEGNRNGVYCYLGEACGSLPTNSFRDSNYWVTPLYGTYDFSGFYQPVDNSGIYNKAKAGSAIPLKFSLSGYEGMDIFAVGFPKFTVGTCQASAPTDAIETTVTAGGSGLSYDTAVDQYVYVWKTEKAWAGKCGTLTIMLKDGTSHTALFQLTK